MFTFLALMAAIRGVLWKVLRPFTSSPAAINWPTLFSSPARIALKNSGIEGVIGFWVLLFDVPEDERGVLMS